MVILSRAAEYVGDVAGTPQAKLIPAADAHKLIGEHALFLLDRALEAWRGSFAFKADAPAPPGAFALGQKWTLLAEAVRRMDATALNARLSQKLARPVQRSGGSSIGKLEELSLTAQEARLFAAVDGTRSGEELAQQHAAAMPVRILYLLSELKPCLMMSPLTVSSFLAPTHTFDLVIFDEASKVPP